MNKHHLIRKISCIHAVKCNKTESFLEAVRSNDKLSELIKELIDADDHNLEEVNTKVTNWAGENPIATDADISELMQKK